MEKNFKIKTLVSASLLLSGLALAGCSSGGGGSSATLDGIYSGSITGGDTDANGSEEKAIVYNGRLMVLSNNIDGVSQIFDGNLTESATSLTGSGARYAPAGLFANDIAYDGSFVAGQTATIGFEENTTGTVTLSPGTINLTSNTAIYTKGSDIARLAGTWSGIFVAGSNAGMTLNIGSDGVIGAGSGDSGDGADCVFTGSFSVIDASINVYSVNLVSEGGSGNIGTACHVSAGSYSGHAWTEGDADGTLVLMAADGNRGRAVVLTKN